MTRAIRLQRKQKKEPDLNVSFHEGFLKRLHALDGKTIKKVSIGQIQSHITLKIEVEDVVLCAEIAKAHPSCWGGRLFIMGNDAADGAGVFEPEPKPILEEKK